MFGISVTIFRHADSNKVPFEGGGERSERGDDQQGYHLYITLRYKSTSGDSDLHQND